MFPQDIFDLIAIFSGQYNVLHTFKLTPQVYNAFFQKNVSLVYGQVQSGKTAMIMRLIQNSPLRTVLIIQNSLLVFKQYMQRFALNHIQFETVHHRNHHAKVFILMNNSSQYRKFLNSYDNTKFSLFMDESDITHNNPLVHLATNQFHITATPFNYSNIFDRIIRIQPPHNYYGIERVQFLPKTYDSLLNTDFEPIIQDFISTSHGILLINQFAFVSQMNSAALELSNLYDIPVIVLSTVKKVYIRGKFKFLRLDNISDIIDSFNQSHIIIIANRMANRGLSYVSSDFKRHITHQVFGHFYNITSFLQKSRIFGIYNDFPSLKVYLPPTAFKKVISYVNKIHLDYSLIKHSTDNLYYYQN